MLSRVFIVISAALCRLGEFLERRRRLHLAAAVYRFAAVGGTRIRAHYGLGRVATRLGDVDTGVAALRRVTELQPTHAAAHNTLGMALQRKGDLDESIASFDRAAACDPSDTRFPSNSIYYSMFHACGEPAGMLERQRRWNAQYVVPLRERRPEHLNDRSLTRPLRIGYVSGDFRYHVVGLNLLPVFQMHDRQGFGIYCYSNVAQADEFTAYFRGLSTQWCDISELSDDAASERIHRDRIDVLVDLSLHMERNRLLVFAREPAPVQVSFGGYPGGTGIETIGYRLTDPFLDPAGSEVASVDQPIRLPNSFWCYGPIGSEPAVNALPALENGFVTFGCMNNFCKVNDKALELWAQVLRRVPDSHLRLLAPTGSARQLVSEKLMAMDIDPARAHFTGPLPRTRYMRQFNQVDISLDTLPYNGHTTSLDSFYMGVPVVTMVGKTAVGRAGWSQLNNLQLTELAAENAEQFVETAIDLAADVPKLSHLRLSLRARMERSPLMDAASFTRGIEAAYRTMWEEWCKGISPA